MDKGYRHEYRHSERQKKCNIQLFLLERISEVLTKGKLQFIPSLIMSPNTSIPSNTLLHDSNCWVEVVSLALTHGKFARSPFLFYHKPDPDTDLKNIILFLWLRSKGKRLLADFANEKANSKQQEQKLCCNKFPTVNPFGKRMLKCMGRECMQSASEVQLVSVVLHRLSNDKQCCPPR